MIFEGIQVKGGDRGRKPGGTPAVRNGQRQASRSKVTLQPRFRVGLALSSGAARGLAHIGVIQVLEENNVPIDVIAGSSMGAYIAAVWGCGLNGREMAELAGEINGRLPLWRLVDPVFPPRTGFMRGNVIIRRLKRTIGTTRFENLVRPIRIVATQFDTLERVVFASGEVSHAVHASCAIPGICVPVRIDGEAYMDGGISDPVPVDVLQELGTERVIAVNVLPTPAYLACVRERRREIEAEQASRRSLQGFLHRHLNYFAPGNLLDIMNRAVQGGQIRVAEVACRAADLVLRPLTMDSQWHEFNQSAKFIEAGRRAALEHLDEIKALVEGNVDEKTTLKRSMVLAA